jgi:hypothetical protein
MRTFLIVAGAVWFTLACVMVFSLAFAARRRTPLPGAALAESCPAVSDSIPQAEIPASNTSDTTVVANYELEPRPLG